MTNLEADHDVSATLPPDVDPAVVPLLERTLVRFHPSFRFEERLATRLRLAAQGTSADAVSPQLIPFPLAGDAAPVLGPVRSERSRRLLVGGAVASGVSLAGAAVVAALRRSGPA